MTAQAADGASRSYLAGLSPKACVSTAATRLLYATRYDATRLTEISLSRRLSHLLDRSFIFAIPCHIRGGSDLGRGGYDDGKLDHKEKILSPTSSRVPNI